MTFQSPPPPPPPPPASGGQGGPTSPQAGYGPPPPGQGWSAPPTSPYGSPRPTIDPTSVHSLDWAILAAGTLAFIFSFVDYYTVGPFGLTAWHGFFGWFAALGAVAGSAAVAVEVFSPQARLPIGNRLAGLGAYALATLCVFIALFVYPGSSFELVGHGAGYWLSLIVIAAGAVLSFLRFQQTGGSLPGSMSGPGSSGRGGAGGRNGSGPSGGYPPPRP
jgi:hypothetical protein